ncbi:hypothetical protein HMPREF1552_02025 [Leptotrichia sp. oral taxon 879 str. F0557]|nr:hypothetical protein HMPREF1552_02025 [Leptotrichia sp. oral taxon 879 str. F0557]
MDNTRFYGKRILEKRIKKTGHYLLFLLRYLLDLNQIKKHGLAK